jgi:hypothetical protein
MPTVAVRDAGGATAALVPAEMDTLHADPDGEVTMFEATVPAAGAQSVAAVEGGTILAERRRSAHPPRVRVIAPTRGSRVGGQGPAVVRWRATDADRDALTVALEYSRNDGATWERMYVGPNTGSARLSNRFFSAAPRARVRARVLDRFDEGAATSAPFRALGALPTVAIGGPRSLRLANDARLELRGDAFDDRGGRAHLRGSANSVSASRRSEASSSSLNLSRSRESSATLN